MTVPPPDSAILREAAARGLGEDLGPADITSLAVVDPARTARARIFAKQPGTLSGLVVAETVFREVHSGLRLTARTTDGSPLAAGDTVLEIAGPAAAILTGERTALNFLQHLSGIATFTRRFVDATAGTSCRILDTRKTLPGLRALEKYAVRCGGGHNHRMGLYDAFMIKDNHVALMNGPGGLAEAVRRARAFQPDAHLTVEADTLEQVGLLATLDLDLNRILLDNMGTPTLREAVALTAGRCELEASGNMTLDRIPEVAATGVDFISVGALTHSATALDFSLEILPS
ncbi:MAG: carboxylating nicotinate-nucleotide diphosphorylase [Candidatus Methylacidiphilales bacterium]|nr:carboxylating nicotinate-nucleotide diphosphorylase [Candidatus Methylacidiphilales bacterium]